MSEGYSVKAELSAVDKGLVSTLERAIKSLDSLNRSVSRMGDIILKAKDNASAPIREVQSAVKKLDGEDADVTVDADTEQAVSDVSDVQNLVEKLEDAGAKVEVSAEDNASGPLNTVKNEAAEINGENVNITINANDSQFETVLGKVQSKVGSIFHGMLEGAGEKIFDTLKDGSSDLFETLNAGEKTWKTFEGNMAQMGESASQIASTKAELQDYAKATIYNSSEMASTYSQLAAVGVKSADKLVESFGSIAASAEDPAQAMKSMSLQATQMAAKPKVAWQDFNIMLQSAPAGMAAVAKEMGMSTSQLISNIQAGTVSTQDFFNAIEKAGGQGTQFAKMATQFQTVDQAMDGMTESLADKLMPAYDAFQSVAIKALNSVSDALDSVDLSFLPPVIEAVGGAFDDLIQGASSLFQALNKAGVVQALGNAFAGLVSALGKAASALGGFLGKMNPQVLQAVSVAAVGTLAAFKGFNLLKSLNPFKGFGKKATSEIGQAVSGMESGKSKIAQIVESLGSVLKGAGEGLKNAFMGLGAGLSTVAKGIGTGLATAFKGIGEGLAAIPPTTILAISVAIVAVGAAMALAGSQGSGLSQIITAVGNAFANFAPVVEATGAAISTVVISLGTAISAIGGVISNAMSGIANVIAGVGNGIKSTFQGIGNAAMGFGNAVKAGLSGVSGIINSVGGVIHAVLGGISGIFDSIGNAALHAGQGFHQLADGVSVITKLNLLDMGASLGAVAVGIGKIASSAGGLSTASQGLTTLVTAISGLNAGAGNVSAALSSISTSAASLGGSLPALSSGLSSAAASFTGFSGNVGAVSGALAQIGGSCASASASIAGLNGALAAGSGAFAGFAGMVTSSLAGVSASISSVGAQCTAAASQMGNGMRNGIENGVRPIPGLVSSALNSMFGVLSGAAGRAQSLGAMIGQGLANGISSMVGSVEAAAARLAAAADRAIQEKAKIGSPSRVTHKDGYWMGAGFVNGIKSTYGDVQRAVDKMYQLTQPTAMNPMLTGNMDPHSYETTFNVNVPLYVDGRAFAKAVATNVNGELTKREKIQSMIKGVR